MGVWVELDEWDGLGLILCVFEWAELGTVLCAVGWAGLGDAVEWAEPGLFLY